MDSLSERWLLWDWPLATSSLRHASSLFSAWLSCSKLMICRSLARRISSMWLSVRSLRSRLMLRQVQSMLILYCKNRFLLFCMSNFNYCRPICTTYQVIHIYQGWNYCTECGERARVLAYSVAFSSCVALSSFCSTPITSLEAWYSSWAAARSSLAFANSLHSCKYI